MLTWLSNVLARLRLGWVTVWQKCHYAIGSGISLKDTREFNVKNKLLNKQLFNGWIFVDFKILMVEKTLRTVNDFSPAITFCFIQFCDYFPYRFTNVCRIVVSINMGNIICIEHVFRTFCLIFLGSTALAPYISAALCGIKTKSTGLESTVNVKNSRVTCMALVLQL